MPSIAVYQSVHVLLTDRYRGQAPSHIRFVYVLSQAACWNCCRYWFGDNSVCCLNNRAKKLASS